MRVQNKHRSCHVHAHMLERQRKQTRRMVNKVTHKKYLKRSQKRRGGFARYYFAVCLDIAWHTEKNVDDPLPEQQDFRKTIIIRQLQHKYCVERDLFGMCHRV